MDHHINKISKHLTLMQHEKDIQYIASICATTTNVSLYITTLFRSLKSTVGGL